VAEPAKIEVENASRRVTASASADAELESFPSTTRATLE